MFEVFEVAKGREGRSNVLDDHTGLDDSGLDSSDGHCSDSSDLVNILEGKSEGLVGGSGRGLDGVDSLEEGLSLKDTSLGLLGPSLVPSHAVGGKRREERGQRTTFEGREKGEERGKGRKENELGGLLDHVVSVPSRDGDEGDGLGVVSDL